MIHIVEAFEGKYCIIETDGHTKPVLRGLVDSAVEVGDVVEWHGGKWVANKDKTKARTKEMKALMDEVWGEE